MTPYNPQ
jgi:hypothetical protein